MNYCWGFYIPDRPFEHVTHESFTQKETNDIGHNYLGCQHDEHITLLAKLASGPAVNEFCIVHLIFP